MLLELLSVDSFSHPTLEPNMLYYEQIPLYLIALYLIFIIPITYLIRICYAYLRCKCIKRFKEEVDHISVVRPLI